MLSKIALVAILFVFCLAPAAVTSGQSRAPITGEWRIEFTRKNPDEVQLNMTRGRQNNWGNGIKISEVQGLSRDYATTAAANVTMRIVRDAGTFELTGSFSNGKGEGRFTLTPNDSFFSALAARGYTSLSENQVFSAAMSGLKLSSIDELKSAGYDQLTFDNLIESAIFKITAASIADLRSVGFDHLPFQKLVELRVHKITPEYINEVRGMGFNDLTLDRLVELKIFKVTPEFVNEIRAAGFAAVTPQQLVQLRIFKIDGDFARKAKGSNPSITVEDMVEQKIFEKRSTRD